MKREFILIFLGLILSIYMVASFQVNSSVSPLEMNPNQSETYTIVVNNTNTGPNANVTQVNITLPGSFTFTEGSNATSTTGTFQNNSNVLSWTNSSSPGNIINENEVENFVFEASASTEGVYNLTVTVVNMTGSYDYNLSVTIADFLDPIISYESGTPSNGATLNQTYIHVNVSATDNIAVDTITVFIYNETESLINSFSNQTDILSVNFTGLTEGEYYVNATVNDTSGNSDSTSTRFITLSITGNTSQSPSCTTNWTCTDWGECTNNNQIRTCIDSNNCNITTGKPTESQTCGNVCTPNWDCTDWSECNEEGFQTRACNDLNSCGLAKPTESLSCTSEDKGGSTNSLIWIIMIIVILIVASMVGGYFYLGRKGNSGSSGKLNPSGRGPPSGPSPRFTSSIGPPKIKGPLFRRPIRPFFRSPPRGIPPAKPQSRGPPRRGPPRRF